MYILPCDIKTVCCDGEHASNKEERKNCAAKLHYLLLLDGRWTVVHTDHRTLEGHMLQRATDASTKILQVCLKGRCKAEYVNEKDEAITTEIDSVTVNATNEKTRTAAASLAAHLNRNSTEGSLVFRDGSFSGHSTKERNEAAVPSLLGLLSKKGECEADEIKHAGITTLVNDEKGKLAAARLSKIFGLKIADGTLAADETPISVYTSDENSNTARGSRLKFLSNKGPGTKPTSVNNHPSEEQNEAAALGKTGFHSITDVSDTGATNNTDTSANTDSRRAQLATTRVASFLDDQSESGDIGFTAFSGEKDSEMPADARTWLNQQHHSEDAFDTKLAVPSDCSDDEENEYTSSSKAGLLGKECKSNDRALIGKVIAALHGYGKSGTAAAPKADVLIKQDEKDGVVTYYSNVSVQATDEKIDTAAFSKAKALGRDNKAEIIKTNHNGLANRAVDERKKKAAVTESDPGDDWELLEGARVETDDWVKVHRVKA